MRSRGNIGLLSGAFALAVVLAVAPPATVIGEEAPASREVGCFAEDPQADSMILSARDLDGATFKDPSMTPEKCLNLCADQGFNFAGLQEGSWCFCGNNYERPADGGASCTTECAGDPSRLCGGKSATEVYEILEDGERATPTPTPTPTGAPAPTDTGPAHPDVVQRTPLVFPVGKWPEGIAWDGSSLWVAESGQRRLARLDPDTGTVRERVRVGRLPVGVTATSDGRVFAAVATDKTIWQQPAGGGRGSVLARLQDYPQAIDADDEALWVLTWVGGSSSQTQVVRIDLETGRRFPSAILPRNGFDLTVAGDIVWVLHRYDGQDLCELLALDKDLLSELSRTSFAGFVSLLAASEQGVFAAGGEFGNNGLVVKLDPMTGQELARHESFDIIQSIATDGDDVIAIDAAGEIWILSADDLSPKRSIELAFPQFRAQSVLPLGEQLFIATHQGEGGNGSVLVVEDWRP